MADQSNFLRLTEAIGIVQDTLAPFVERELKRAGGGVNWWKQYVWNVVSPSSREKLPMDAKAGVSNNLARLDVSELLQLISRNFAVAFRGKLPDTAKSYAEELRGHRNLWAHKGAGDIESAQAERAIDTAALLLDAIDKAAAEKVRALKSALGSKPAGGARESTGSSPVDANGPAVRAATPPLDDAALAPPAPSNAPWTGTLRAWWEHATPREDVRTGKLTADQFAADLAKVALTHDAKTEYQDPVEFFKRTFLTASLKELLANAVERLAGRGGEPVIQLKTGFGGGKTHSMLALYHLAKGGDALGGIDQIQALASDAGAALSSANVAVLVGTYVDATRQAQDDELKSLGLALNTLWGRMAWQLGGRTAYALVEKADVEGVAPGGETLNELFEMCEPCVVLIDELVAFARNLPDRKGAVVAGTLEQNMTFIQNLTEAASRRARTLLVASIPESDQEIGGPAGQRVLSKIENVFKRLERPWTPVESGDAFEVVRRRLFEDTDEKVRREVVGAFTKHYRNNRSDFPQEVAERTYEERMLAAFPFHPELFDRLYEDWNAGIAHFQSTRGVLRLLAATVQRLWEARDSSPLIMPGTLPLDDANVRDEFMSYLPRPFQPVIEGDIDGARSETRQIDAANPRFQRVDAARSLARTIFLGSVPGKSVPGIEANRVLLGACRPGESVSTYNDALGRLRAKLQFLHGSEGRYWFGTQPNLNKTVADREVRISEEEALAFVEELLKADRDAGDFATKSVAPAPADVPDDPVSRLIVVSPRHPHDEKDEESPAVRWAKELADTRGTGPRLSRNMLTFAAFDADARQGLVQQVKTHRAWASIVSDRQPLNLSDEQLAQAKEQSEAARRGVEAAVSAGYKWALLPRREAVRRDDAWTLTEERWLAVDLTTTLAATGGLARKVTGALQHHELLLTAWSPMFLSQELEKWFWSQGLDHVTVKSFWEENLSRYVYFPRLRDREVLARTIAEGATTKDFYGYAAGFEDGRYLGLKFGQKPGSVLFDAAAVIVRKDVAAAAAPVVDGAPAPPQGPVPTPGGGGRSPEPLPAPRTRFYGSVKLNKLKLSSSAGTVGDEIVRHLEGLVGSNVEVTLEIHATVKDGIPDVVVRTVSENANTLKFETFEFYDD